MSYFPYVEPRENISKPGVSYFLEPVCQYVPDVIRKNVLSQIRSPGVKVKYTFHFKAEKKINLSKPDSVHSFTCFVGVNSVLRNENCSMEAVRSAFLYYWVRSVTHLTLLHGLLLGYPFKLLPRTNKLFEHVQIWSSLLINRISVLILPWIRCFNSAKTMQSRLLL